jgi:AcrR family transcriptional regulator
MEEKDIIAAAAELFLRYGIKSITMDEIARQMGISKKTLYRHFKDKKDLVEKTLHEIVCLNKATINEIMGKGKNAIEEVFEMYNHANEIVRDYNPTLEFDLQRQYPKVFRQVREMHRNQIFEAILQNLRKGKKEGLYRKDIDTDIISKLYVMRMENMMHHDFITPEELHSKKFFKEVFKYHLFAIMSADGLEFVKISYPEFIKK